MSRPRGGGRRPDPDQAHPRGLARSVPVDACPGHAARHWHLVLALRGITWIKFSPFIGMAYRCRRWFVDDRSRAGLERLILKNIRKIGFPGDLT
ncbi:hypothetical protein [Solidesulfovibrio fructosivorans]|uniref:hypothetical protein n=1 Tax=Solidesulfovibrio fructosivorans TaxID=878 RepID=UPI0002EA60A7|nr:hypothetical protein [Solidesulfovibrio fructosivorans]